MTNVLIDEKKKHEGNISHLEIKMRNKVMTSEEEIKCQKLKIEAGKTNMQKLVDNNNHVVSGQLEDQLVKSEQEVKVLKRLSENLISILEKEKKEREVKVFLLENKEKETSMIYEEEIKTLKLQIMEGKTSMKEVKAKHKQIFDQLKDQLSCPVCSSRSVRQGSVANQLPQPAAPSTSRTIPNTRKSALLLPSGDRNCICFRPLQLVMCQLCGETFSARVRRVCSLHPHAVYLQDVKACKGCKQDNTKALKEFELLLDMVENVKVKKIRWIGRN
eukprot:GFUD01039862.1.p1 GENE.GFUD01039862.1~~GFUD01039862.1.p1  ORF type:complete len:274 (+),score=83.77 GFUD01039862.1:118-939(+)